jgi:Lamin Tail Domain
MNRRLARLTFVGLVALIVAALVVPAAPGAIRLARIYYDSPGSDTGSNRSLNAEWVRLKNTGTAGRHLRGWRVRDISGHVYVFGRYTLRAGRTVTIHTGRGTNTQRHRYWRLGNYVWNNDRDRATLKKPNGVVVDRCAYGPSSALPKVC